MKTPTPHSRSALHIAFAFAGALMCTLSSARSTPCRNAAEWTERPTAAFVAPAVPDYFADIDIPETRTELKHSLSPITAEVISFLRARFSHACALRIRTAPPRTCRIGDPRASRPHRCPPHSEKHLAAPAA